MKKINSYEVTLFGDICGIKAEFTILAQSLKECAAHIRLHVSFHKFTDIGRVMVLAHVGSSAKDDKLYIAPSMKLNFKLDL